jgi:Domain of unknown function (DUF4157)
VTAPRRGHAAPAKTDAPGPREQAVTRPAAAGWRRALGNAAVAALAADPEQVADGLADRVTGTRWAGAGHRLPPPPGGSPLPPGAGRPLDHGVRARLEEALGANLDTVRVHDDAAAYRAAEQLGAAAFAAGTHIAFARGAYAPGTQRGDWLLAHEVAHVVQHDPADPDVVRFAPEDVPMLDQRLYDGVQRGSSDGYRQAAEALNRFSVEDILLRLSRTPGPGRRVLSRGQIAAVHVAARDHTLLGPGSNAAVFTRPAYLDVTFENERARGDWAAAAEQMNAFNDPDMNARLRALPLDQLQALKEGADRNPRVGPGSAVARNTATAIADAPRRTATPGGGPARPSSPQQAQQLRTWAETPAADPPRAAGSATPPTVASETKLSTLIVLTAKIGLAVLGIEVQRAVPPHFFEFASARRGFVAGVTGLPLEPPTDEFELKEWERGENVAAICIAAEMMSGGTPPPGGQPGPVPAPVGGGRVHLDVPPVARPAGAPMLEARTPTPAGGAATATATAPAPARGPSPAPESDAERRARLARNPTVESPATKPGETPQQAKERTDAAQRQFEESGREVTKIVGPTQEHHVVSNKAPNSPAARESIEILQNARTSAEQADVLTSDANIVRVENHGDAHGENYHVIIRNRLRTAVAGKQPRTPEYRDAVLAELGRIKLDCQTKGTTLNRMTVKVSTGGMR